MLTEEWPYPWPKPPPLPWRRTRRPSFSALGGFKARCREAVHSAACKALVAVLDVAMSRMECKE